MRRLTAREEAAEKAAPKPDETTLLTQIRDLLARQIPAHGKAFDAARPSRIGAPHGADTAVSAGM